MRYMPAEEARSGRRREDKAAWWMMTVACDQRCISSVSQDVGCDEYIDRRHGGFRGIKAAGGRWTALNWNRFSVPFSPRLYLRKKSGKVSRANVAELCPLRQVK
jgi:hypothetical protein